MTKHLEKNLMMESNLSYAVSELPLCCAVLTNAAKAGYTRLH